MASSGSDPAVFDDSDIDLDSYQLDGLQQDLRELVDIGSAISTIAMWAGAAALAGGVVTWFIFDFDSTPGRVLVAAVAAAFAALPAAVVAFGRVVHGRLSRVERASNDVVGVVGRIHADVIAVKDGYATTSLRDVASTVLQRAVVPIVISTASGFVEGLAGPLGFVVRRADSVLIALVNRVSARAVATLPDRALGQLVEVADKSVEAHAAAGLERIGVEYERAVGGIERIMGRATAAVVVFTILVAIVATLPLLAWWGFSAIVT